MSLSRNLMEFSPNAEYFAYSSPDGVLKIWETSSNILKQEYTPSSHLSTTCSSLSWGPCRKNIDSSKKCKKSKSDGVFKAVSDLQIIALGTLTGGILLYSFTKAELHSTLSEGHTAKVNDISWNVSADYIFSCSDDQHIIIWDIPSGKIKMKWKADTVPIHSICVIDKNNLLSSSSSILLWDLKKMCVLKTFSGHATEVFRLLSVKTDEESPNSYFLSAAVGDRIINAWQLGDNNTKRTAVSFVLSDEPEHINIVSGKSQPLYMSVVCKDGFLHIFEHVLNGKMKKPFQPKFTIQIASKTNQSDCKPYPVPILSANINAGLNSCLLLYGSFLRPVFEKIDLSEISKDLFLIRDVSVSSSKEENISRIKQTDKSGKVKLLAPGCMVPLHSAESTSRKRKLNAIDIRELPLEERLKALDLSKIPENIADCESSVKSDSMVHLLLQGLQSKDKQILNTVFQCADENVIHKTLERLPLSSILLVLKELHLKLYKQEPRTHPCLRWLKALLSIHLPYLMSCKDVEEYLGPINQVIEARVQSFAKMYQLQGCLKLLLSQSTDITTTSSREVASEPSVVYESASSEAESDAGEVDLSGNSDREISVENNEVDESTSDSDDDMES